MTVSTQHIADQLLELMELRRKFEKDKVRVAELKASRNFKLY